MSGLLIEEKRDIRHGDTEGKAALGAADRPGVWFSAILAQHKAQGRRGLPATPETRGEQGLLLGAQEGQQCCQHLEFGLAAPGL